MELIRSKAFARAGLIGNPSDGYHGRTLSVIIPNYWAEVVLYEWEDLEIILSPEDRSRYGSIFELQHAVQLHGYYGGARLVKATIKRFVEYCLLKGIRLHERNFSIRYGSRIPRAVGLAGSSAIIVATLRALQEYYHVEISQDLQPSIALAVETQDLGIVGGLQDRVIQVMEGLVYMDFSSERVRVIDGYECGVYERLPVGLLPPVYVAYSLEAGEPTEVTHGPLRSRYLAGDSSVRDAMVKFATLAADGYEAIKSKDVVAFSRLMNANFDLRRSICDISPTHMRMIDVARRTGASAKFAGSGGAIVGVYFDDQMFDRLVVDLAAIGCKVIKLDLNQNA